MKNTLERLMLKCFSSFATALCIWIGLKFFDDFLVGYLVGSFTCWIVGLFALFIYDLAIKDASKAETEPRVIVNENSPISGKIL